MKLILLIIVVLIIFQLIIITKIDFSNLKSKKIYSTITILTLILSIFSSILFSNNQFSSRNNENIIVDSNIDINVNSSMQEEILSNIESSQSDVEKYISIDLQDNLQYSKDFTSYLTETRESIEYSSQLPSFDTNSIIAKNSFNGKEYTLSQLEKEKLFIPYREKNKEILFYGSYNNSYLNGNCIYNVYKNNQLEMILEAEYENGNLLSYRKITSDITPAGVNTWNVSYRENKINYNSGITLNYFKYDNYTKNFNLDNATANNLLYVNEFESKLKDTTILEGYYNGNTSDGYYNDNTGNAYMIKFFDDGTVRMLYHGNFRDGYPDDSTGNAWDIVKNKNTGYMYYKGNFKNGSTTNSKGFIFENDLTFERINEILEQNNFKIAFELNWDNILKSNT